MNHHSEEWRPIAGWPYEISSLGNVRKLGCGTMVKTRVQGHGYVIFNANNGKRRTPLSVHRCVCEAFHGPAPTGAHEVCHYDGDRTNNRPSNLRWGTHVENCADMERHGVKPRGTKHKRAKITEEIAREIWRLRATTPVKKIHTILGIGFGVVSNVLYRGDWGWVNAHSDASHSRPNASARTPDNQPPLLPKETA